MSQRGRILLLVSLVCIDAMAIIASLGLPVLLPASTPLPSQFYQPYLLPAVGLFLVIFWALRLYDLDIILEDSQEYAMLANGCTYGTLSLALGNLLLRHRELPLTWLLTSWLLSVVLVGLGRFILRRVVRFGRRRGHWLTRALIVGADGQGRAIARQFQAVSASGIEVLGFVDDFLPLGTPVEGALRVLGHPSQLQNLVHTLQVSELVVVPGAVAWETFNALLHQATRQSSVQIRLSPGYYELLANTPRVAHRNFVPLMMLEQVRVSGLERFLKFAVDYGAGLLALLLSLPILLGIMLYRQLTGKRIFVQQRVLGLGGRVYDVRILDCKVGSFLQRSGLANLPLLFDIFTGKLSLVGPRPILATSEQQYAPWLSALATLRPGVTGPWAVVPVASIEEEMRATLYYLRNWTVWLDIQILAQTVLVGLRQRWGRLNEQ
jgi:lipopolysaccharide/colanic/teichoic acid biosynthesis glycosyltransferase